MHIQEPTILTAISPNTFTVYLKDGVVLEVKANSYYLDTNTAQWEFSNLTSDALSKAVSQGKCGFSNFSIARTHVYSIARKGSVSVLFSAPQKAKTAEVGNE